MLPASWNPGSQRNLNVHGACASVNSPTTRMSTPDLRIQSGIATQISPRGIPEANDINVTEAVRHDVNAWPRLWKVPGLLGGGVGAMVKRMVPLALVGLGELIRLPS